jgi:heterodisulfide reductase subunit C
MIKILRDNLQKVYQKIAESKDLYLPINKANEVNYGKYEDGVNVSIETLKTVKSAKDFFFPQSENMMKFKTELGKIEIENALKDVKDFVIFGVRACDYKSFEVLDNVFLSEPVDTFYKERRESACIVTLACNKPETSCFCKVFGIDASNPLGDVSSWLDEKYLYLQANTVKGEELISLIKEFSEDGGEKEVEEIKKGITEIINKLPYSNLDLSRFKPENLNELFELEDWKELSEGCLGCGACTFVCPTCQCFDIRDFKTNDGVIRFRCWDSCMYSDFTQMAAENSRKTQMQRFRQRFMHKLCYFPSQYNGVYSCVGCGRCVNKCPQHLNIIKVIKKIGSENND